MDANTVRKYVDGEMNAEEAAAFESRLTGDDALRAQMTFERSLRSAVERHMTADAPLAPESLRAAIREMTAAETMPATAEPAATDSSGFSRLREVFSGPKRANIFAVAACLLLVGSAVVVGMFGDEWGLGLRRSVHPMPIDEDFKIMATTVQQARGEHQRCLDIDSRTVKIHYRTAQEIRRNLNRRLGAEVPVFDLSRSGLELVGGGECSLHPKPNSTVHLFFTDGSSDAAFSVFLQVNDGQFGGMENALATGKVYTPQDLEVCPGEPTGMFTDGRLVYITRASNAELHERGVRAILRALAMSPE